MKDKFWENKNVLITGINGFIGGNLAEEIVDRGANVFGLVRNLNSKSYLFYSNISSKTELINGSITDKELLKGFFSENQIDICFHLAAQVEVGVAAEYPYLTWETNVRGTYCLLEAIRESCKNIKAIVIASSDKAYGEYPTKDLPYKEDYALKPKYPYDTSKACADMIAQSYSSDLYNMPIIITRFANIFGPGQLNFSALIPDAIRSALGLSKFIPRSNGKSKRDFLYVKDVSDLYCTIAENLSKDKTNLKGQIFNAGTNEEHSVRGIVEKIFSSIVNDRDLKKIIKSFEENPVLEGEINEQLMDFEKVNKHFGWSPKTGFNIGLKETIKWYKEYLFHEKNSI
jgi:CDP-glucose 4,6-dehydratase